MKFEAVKQIVIFSPNKNKQNQYIILVYPVEGRHSLEAGTLSSFSTFIVGNECVCVCNN